MIQNYDLFKIGLQRGVKIENTNIVNLSFSIHCGHLSLFKCMKPDVQFPFFFRCAGLVKREIDKVGPIHRSSGICK